MGTSYHKYVGMVFERLTVVEVVEKDRHGTRRLQCTCTCGNTVYASAYNLRIGDTKSCGCLRRERVSVRVPMHERFWSKVDKNGPVQAHVPHIGQCWVWKGFVASDGYGRFENTTTQRVSFYLTHGRWPTLCVMHACDYRSCVRPEHLSEGTHTENIADALRKGRLGTSRLTPDQVQAVRAAAGTGTHGQIAARFGVDRCTVRDILSGRSWKHLP